MNSRYSLLYDGLCHHAPMLAFALLAIAFLCPIRSIAQPAGISGRDSKGTLFWVAFMENYGSGAGVETSDLRLYISSDTITTATVHYFFTGDSVQIDIPVPNVPVEVNIPEIFGYYTELSSGDQGVTRKAFKITAQHEVTLYGVNIRKMSSDAFLGLPDDIITRRYVILAYPNGVIQAQFGFRYADMASEFAVIATEDNTQLKISPSTPINNRLTTAPFTVNLNRGEAYFGQANLEEGYDVSGTEVLANKPVALFSGNRRTSIPNSVGSYRDHLVEQMIPLEAWGTSALITPFYPISPASPYTAVVRVLAAVDGTPWTINGAPQSPLQAGRSREVPLSGPMFIEASGPIMVAQYEHSAGDTDPGGSVTEVGDPFMMLIPPPEQFDTAYSFQSVAHPEFTNHFVNVVIPTDAIPSLTIDGAIPSASFSPIGSTRFSYAQVRLTAGSHTARADSAFGLYSYGYGFANSYGYPGGMLFKALLTDFQPPELFSVDTCGGIAGTVSDAHITDTGIDSLFVVATENMNAMIEPFTPGDDTVHYWATLVDPYQDGMVALKAIDSGGRSRFQQTRVPGFTVRAVGMNGNAPLLLDTLVTFNDQAFCQTVMLENYGAYPQAISNIKISGGGPGVTLKSSVAQLLPGERQPVEICYTATNDTSFTVQLELQNNCVSRVVAQVPLNHRVDTVGPAILGVADPCVDGMQLQTGEQWAGSGITEIWYDELVNCTTAVPAQKFSPAMRNVAVSLNRIDPRLDMIYQITVVDAVGNRTVRRDTIGGFTLAAYDAARQQVAIRLERDWQADSITYGNFRCDSITLTNNGLRPLQIAEARMRGNINFSIPPAQLPLLLAPGQSRRLVVCLLPTADGNSLQADTLELVNLCGVREEVALKLPVTWLSGTGQDGCNNALRVQMFAAARRTFLGLPTPNPGTNSASRVDVALAQQSHVWLDVVDQQGNIAAEVLRNVELRAGVHRVEYLLEQIPSGQYFVRMRTNHGQVFTQKLILHQ